MLSPGLRAANEAKNIRANCRIKNSIMFGATKSSSGPEPKYAPIAAVTIERANKLYTFFIKTIRSVIETDEAGVTPRISVAVDPSLIMSSYLIALKLIR